MQGTDLQLFYDNIAREDYFHNTVKVTLDEIYHIMESCYGPYGSHILIDNQIRPEATKDGKTILSKITTNGSISSAVLKSILSVSERQVEEVGDGSTTTMLLLCDLYGRFRKIIESRNVSSSVFQKDLDNVVSTLIEKLKISAKKVVDNGIINYDRLKSAVYTSVDADHDLCDIIIELIKELNTTDPYILIELGDSVRHRYELVKGTECRGTIIMPEVFFNGFSRMTYDNPNIILINGRLDISTDMYMDLCSYAMKNEKNYIFLCTGVNESLQNSVATMAKTGGMNTFVRCPWFQINITAADAEFMDFAAMTGATYIDNETIVRNWSRLPAILNTIEKCSGRCEKSLMTEFCARFNNPESNDEQINNRVNEINEKITMLKEDPTAANERLVDLENRKAMLTKNFAKLYIGGQSPQRRTINYELADDGVRQACSCLKYGVVDGCNIQIPNIICTLNPKEFNNIELDIFHAIKNAYINAFCVLVYNKHGHTEEAEEIINSMLPNEDKDFTPIDLRGENQDILNSADTDRAILSYSTNMASLLATSKTYIGKYGSNEFDIISKGYSI